MWDLVFHLKKTKKGRPPFRALNPPPQKKTTFWLISALVAATPCALFLVFLSPKNNSSRHATGPLHLCRHCAARTKPQIVQSVVSQRPALLLAFARLLRLVGNIEVWLISRPRPDYTCNLKERRGQVLRDTRRAVKQRAGGFRCRVRAAEMVVDRPPLQPARCALAHSRKRANLQRDLGDLASRQMSDPGNLPAQPGMDGEAEAQLHAAKAQCDRRRWVLACDGTVPTP
jgi:hypothetical protein